jgi:hypothetical protein
MVLAGSGGAANINGLHGRPFWVSARLAQTQERRSVLEMENTRGSSGQKLLPELWEEEAPGPIEAALGSITRLALCSCSQQQRKKVSSATQREGGREENRKKRSTHTRGENWENERGKRSARPLPREGARPFEVLPSVPRRSRPFVALGPLGCTGQGANSLPAMLDSNHHIRFIGVNVFRCTAFSIIIWGPVGT